MNSDIVKDYINKRVIIYLKTSLKYTCVILRVENETVFIRDKFAKEIPIDCESISVIEPEVKKHEY